MSWKKELLTGASLVFLKQDFEAHNIVNTYTLDHVMSFFNVNYCLTSATITITCFVIKHKKFQSMKPSRLFRNVLILEILTFKNKHQQA